MSKILPNVFFFTTSLTKAHKYLTLSTFLYCFVRSLRFLFQNYTFLKLDKTYFLLFFDHQITKAHKYLTLLYYFFLPDHKNDFFFFFLYLLFFKISLFSKNFKKISLFFFFENQTIESVHTYWHIDFLRKKFHYRRSAKRGLTKKENTRENAF